MTKNQKLSSGSANSTDCVSKLAFLGPSPVLQQEEPADYEKLFARFLDELKPTDLVEEIWIHDVVHWTWELRRLRRIKICLIEAETTAAMVWVLAVPSHMRLAHIGEREIEVTANNSLLSNQPHPSESPLAKPRKRKRSPFLARLMKKISAGDPTAINDIESFMAEAKLERDTIMTRAVLEKLDTIERIDRLAAFAEVRRNAVFREIDRRRASLAYALRKRLEDVEEAEFEVIKLKVGTKKNKPNKSAA